MQDQIRSNTQVAKFQEQINRALEDMRSQLTKFTQTLSVREPGKFPSQPSPNPISQAHRAEGSSSEDHEQVQSVTVLNSGKVIEKPKDPRIVWPTTSKKDQGQVSDEVNDEEVKEGSKEGKKKAEEEEKEQERKQKEKGKSVEERSKFEPRPPFPHQLAQSKRDKANENIYEVFKQVRINIPLLDAIKQTPSYANV